MGTMRSTASTMSATLLLSSLAVAQPASWIKTVASSSSNTTFGIDINQGGEVLVADVQANAAKIWFNGSTSQTVPLDFTLGLSAKGWPAPESFLESRLMRPLRLLDDGTMYAVVSLANCSTPLGQDCSPVGWFGVRRVPGAQSPSFEVFEELGDDTSPGFDAKFSVQQLSNGDHAVAYWRSSCQSDGPGTNTMTCGDTVFPFDNTGLFIRSFTGSTSSVGVIAFTAPASCDVAPLTGCETGAWGLVHGASGDYHQLLPPTLVDLSGLSGCPDLNLGAPNSSFPISSNGNVFFVRPAECDVSYPSGNYDNDPFSKNWRQSIVGVSYSTLSETIIGTFGVPLGAVSGTPYIADRDDFSNTRFHSGQGFVSNSSGDLYAFAANVRVTNTTDTTSDDTAFWNGLPSNSGWVRINGGAVAPVLNQGGTATDAFTLSESRDFYAQASDSGGLAIYRFNPVTMAQPEIIVPSSGATTCNSLEVGSAPATIFAVPWSSGSEAFVNDQGDLVFEAFVNIDTANRSAIVLYTADTNQFYPLVYTGQQWNSTQVIESVQLEAIFASGNGEGGQPNEGNVGRGRRINDSRQVLAAVTLTSGGGKVVVRIDFSADEYEDGCNPPTCNDIDFNNNGVFPEDQDVIDFFAVLAGSTPATCDPVLGCDDIDVNNNGVFPEDADVICFFSLLAGGNCDGVCN